MPPVQFKFSNQIKMHQGITLKAPDEMLQVSLMSLSSLTPNVTHSHICVCVTVTKASADGFGVNPEPN